MCNQKDTILMLYICQLQEYFQSFCLCLLFWTIKFKGLNILRGVKTFLGYSLPSAQHAYFFCCLVALVPHPQDDQALLFVYEILFP